MDLASAPSIADAPLPLAGDRLKTRFVAGFQRLEGALDTQLEQLPLWAVVAFGAGIGLWFWLGEPAQWMAVLCLGSGMAIAGRTFVPGRCGQAMFWTGLMLVAGMTLVWARATMVAAPTLQRPQIVTMRAQVLKAEPRVADGKMRLTLKTNDPALPGVVRVTTDLDRLPAGLNDGALVDVRARLAPPPPMALPGGHDFARDAWFNGLGAVGKALGPITVARPAPPSGLDGLRDRLDAHIQASLPGPAGTIATAFVSGNQNAISPEDATAMRRSGLAHLLSVSGLHIAAVVAATMFLSLRLMALSEVMALRFNLVLVSAGVAAAAGIGYTLLTGAQVPTVRSCIAAVLVLAGLAMGREALSLRLVAAGAMVVLLISPESLVGASFQMSFASVATIIALQTFGPVQRLLARREEGIVQRSGRHLASLVVTGLAVEFALMSFALYHFHRAGFYGVVANLVAIPLTTFVTMPLEALALALDPLGLGHPVWVAVGWSLDVLLGLAHRVASLPGAVAMMPTMPTGAFVRWSSAGCGYFCGPGAEGPRGCCRWRRG